MSPSVPPKDHIDTEMTGMADLAFDSTEWLDDYNWAATELGSPVPDFSSCSFPAAIEAENRDASTTPSGSSTTAEHEHPPPCENAIKQQRSCVGITTGILGSMGSTSSLCMMGSQANALPMSLSNTPTATPTKTTTTPKSCVDAVLSAAQEAGRLICSLLDCPTCRAGPQLQLLLTVAFAEVIACYRRVISTYKNMRTQKNGPQQDDELTRTPLSIGNHRIEGSIETMLVGRVIASRLEDLEALMREILLVPPAACSAVQGHKPEGGEPASRISPSGSTLAALLGEMYLRRDSYLAEQLSAAKRELTELLTHQDARDGRTPVP